MFDVTLIINGDGQTKNMEGLGLIERNYFLLFLSLFLISGCTSNRAIRGGALVEGYPISAIPLPIEEVHYQNLDGTNLYAWFIKQEDYHHKPTILFLHGSRGNISDYLPVIKNLYQTIEANIFACDFPGTGASQGRLSLENTYQMTLAAMDYLANRSDLRKDRFVLFGASLGASLAYYGAARRENLPVIIDSGVTSASDYLKKYTLIGLPDFLLGLFAENFNNYDLVKNLKNPKLFLHGRGDPIIDMDDVRPII